MQTIPSELVDNIFSFVPISSMINENMTKEEMEKLVDGRAEDYVKFGLDPYRYIWSKISHWFFGDYIVRISVTCNEYITEILIMDMKTHQTRTWNLATPIRKRGARDFALTGIDGEEMTISNLTEEFGEFLDGSTTTSIEGKIPRVQYLDYNILETLDLIRLPYEQMIALMRNLYDEGYWLYGGFKNYVKGNTSVPDNLKVQYVRSTTESTTTYDTLEITRDGIVIGEDIPENVNIMLTDHEATVLSI